MTECYSENTLVELAAVAPVSPSVAAHLAECAECRVAMSELTRTSGPVPMTRELLLRRGDRIGRYEVVDLLGRGGVGIVYLARDLTLGRQVALKLMHAERDQQHLLHEAKVTARLRHSNIRTVYDVGLEGDVLFVAMEYVEGTSLRAWLAERPRGWNEVLAVMTQVAAALEAAHAQGHLHCDVKPENVLVSPAGAAWLTDFGFARSERARSPWAGGTVGYLAPELTHGGSPTQLSDQFAFGTTLHEVLAGAARAPRRLRGVAARARASAPRHRFTSMVEVRRRLERVQRPWFGVAQWIGVVGVALVALTATVWQWHEPSRVCAREAERTTELWSGEVRGEVQRVFQRDSNPAASTAWGSVDQRLQMYVTQLAQAQHAACVLEAPALERHATQHCLAQRALEVSALVKQLTRFPEAAVERAPYGVQALGRLSECSDEAVRTAGLLPVPERAPPSVVEQVRRLIANARAMRWLNQPAVGLPVAREAVALARDLSHAPLEADALACLGELLLATGQFDEAAQTLTSAALRAEAGRDLRVRVRALTTLAGLTGSRLGNLAEAVRLQGEAEASLEALGGSPLLLGKLLDNMAAVHFTHQDYRTGLRLSEQAMPLLQQSLGDDHLDVAIAWTNRGIALRGLGETRSAIEAQRRALGIKQHLFGPDHPSVATSLINLGEAHRSRQEWGEAEVLMRRAIDSRERFFGPTHTELGGPIVNLALIELAQGRLQAAEAGLRRAEALFENRVAPDHPERRALLQAWDELRRARR